MLNIGIPLKNCNKIKLSHTFQQFFLFVKYFDEMQHPLKNPEQQKNS